MTRNVILIAPQFPPNPLAGVHRARHLAKHLPAHGWHPIVIRAEDSAYTERLDPALAALVPTSVTQIKTRALNARLSRMAGVGDIGLRGYRQFAGAIDLAVANYDPAAIFITGAPYYPMLLAGRTKRRHGLPVVLDFQDPWVSAHGATAPRWSKAGLAHRLAVVLEPRAVAAASFITSVSQVQNQQMADRYPWLDAAAMAAIPIGGDPEDFAAVRAASADTAKDRINLTYVGAYWPRAEPCLRQLFRGVALLRASSPRLMERLRLNFIGTCASNRPQDEAERPVARIAAQEGVGDVVRESPRRVPFVEALRLMSAADGLLSIGSDEPHYTASKIYPLLMSGRPYLSLYHAESSANAVLRQAGGGCVLTYAPDALDDLPQQIARGLADLAGRPQTFGQVDPRAYQAYTAHAVAGRFAAIFDGLARGGAGQ